MREGIIVGFGLPRRGARSVEEEAQGVWPGVNRLAWIRLPCCESAVHPSRIEDIIGSEALLAAPSKPHLNRLAAPGPDKTFLVGWSEGNAVTRVRVQCTATTEGDVPTWTIRAVSTAELIQRRRYVRASWDQELVCHLPMLDGSVTGKILDFSEGGLRCLLPVAEQPRNPYFQVSFDFEGQPMLLDVEIAWWGSSVESGDVLVGLAFRSQDAALADRLRKHAFALQLAHRHRR